MTRKPRPSEEPGSSEAYVLLGGDQLTALGMWHIAPDEGVVAGRRAADLAERYASTLQLYRVMVPLAARQTAANLLRVERYMPVAQLPRWQLFGPTGRSIEALLEACAELTAGELAGLERFAESSDLFEAVDIDLLEECAMRHGRATAFAAAGDLAFAAVVDRCDAQHGAAVVDEPVVSYPGAVARLCAWSLVVSDLLPNEIVAVAYRPWRAIVGRPAIDWLAEER
jgi:hypothetical protein